MKAFASDFDGTLFHHKAEEKYLREDLEGIRDFQKQGNLFGICTGRSLYGITAVVKDAIDFDFYITNSGARILDKNLNVLYEKTICREIMEAIHETYEGESELVVMANDTVYTTGEPYPLQEAVKSVKEISGPIFGVSIVRKDTKDAKRVVDEINRLYSDDVIAYQNITFVDIVAAGCSKGNAAKFVKEHFQPQLIAGIGDSFNDIPLFKASDVAYTFNRCPEVVRNQAAVCVDTVNEAIKDFMKR